MLADVKPTNYKERAAQIADFLEKYIPDVAAMGRLSNITHWNNDEWNGFADLLANLIEEYVVVLDIDNLSEPPCCDSTENKTVTDSDKNFIDSCIDSKKIG